MKSFFLFTLLTVGVSIACSGYKSAGSPANQGGASPESTSTEAHSSVQPAQEKVQCNLTTSESPAIKGLKLGMTANEVVAIFPGAGDDQELRSQLSRPPGRFGTSSFVIRPEKYQNKESFPGITQITFALLDGRVYTFTINYNGPAYGHVDNFVEKFVEGTNLPAADQWDAYQGMDNQLKILNCKGFELRVFAGGEGGNLNYVLVNDVAAENTLKDRRKKAREQSTPTPLPLK
jgi:hypothetical protein